MCQTDGRTDRQNYDSEDRGSIAASRGKNHVRMCKDISEMTYYVSNGMLNSTQLHSNCTHCVDVPLGLTDVTSEGWSMHAAWQSSEEKKLFALP